MLRGHGGDRQDRAAGRERGGGDAQGPARLFVLATVRRDEVGAEVERVMAAGRRIDQGRFDEDGARGMIGDMLGLAAPAEALVRGVAAHTEGNPLFVAEYLRAAVRAGLLVRDGGGRFRRALDARRCVAERGSGP